MRRAITRGLAEDGGFAGINGLVGAAAGFGLSWSRGDAGKIGETAGLLSGAGAGGLIDGR